MSYLAPWKVLDNSKQKINLYKFISTYILTQKSRDVKGEIMKYQYRELKTNETVEDFMAEDYVLNKLGITITPKGKNGEMTIEQLENIEETINWFFSGNWTKEVFLDD